MCPSIALSGLGAGGLSGSTILGAVSLVGQGIGTMMSLQAQKQAMYYEQQQARLQEQQYKDQADAAQLETIQAESDRRDKYFSLYRENRALMASTGIDLDSPSYRALLKANTKTYKQDISNINLMGSEKRLNALRDAQQASLGAKASKASYKSGVATTIGRSLLTAAETGREFMLPGEVT
tara:strand:+ start:81 stop:620 length:540 start_codon:yes stop_codon:yes gene_type:complete